jgi:hypothetical protein
MDRLSSFVQVGGRCRAIPWGASGYPFFCSGRWEWTGDPNFVQVGSRVSSDFLARSRAVQGKFIFQKDR